MSEIFENSDKEAYASALSALNERDVPYMLGGAFAVYHYSGWLRHTHDMDVYLTPDSVDDAIHALLSAGFTDIGEQAEGDADWIYHAAKGPIIVDLIWRFANLVEYITPGWFNRASRGEFLGLPALFLPLEELIWIKSFVVNRHRCDWPDIFKIVQVQCSNIDWDRLVSLLSLDVLLLAAISDVFDWLRPDLRDCIPERARREFDKARQSGIAPPPDVNRERLLDPWIHLRADSCETRRDE